jgi:ankyrin repeat protein
VDVVRLLLAYGADVPSCYDVALRLASQNGHKGVVKELLGHGANVHARDDELLFKASENGHVEVVKVLLARGASPRIEMVQQARIAGQNEIADLLQAKLGKLSKFAQYLNTRLFPVKPGSAVQT